MWLNWVVQICLTTSGIDFLSDNPIGKKITTFLTMADYKNNQRDF